MSSNRVKILMVGPVNGQLSLLSNKLRTLQNSKAGPFDICLCAGPFFYQTTSTVDSSDNNSNNNSNNNNDERQALKDTAATDEKSLLDNSLTFDLPVLFVDAGDGLPKELQVKLENVMKKDDAEIDLDEDAATAAGGDDNNDSGEAKNDEESDNNCTPSDGLLRISKNLYQLVGGGTTTSSSAQNGHADIISVPLPLIDKNNTEDTATRQHATSLTIGFASSRIRLPCLEFENKAKHTSFLGCDVLISGEWGQGMSSSRCGALTIDDRTTIFGSGDNDDGLGLGGGGGNSMIGSYDVAELIAMSRPRYHLAPGPVVPVLPSNDGDGNGNSVEMRRRFVASLPYRYPATSSSGGTSGDDSHAGRFLACSDVMPPAEAKRLGKAFKFIHAVGIVPLARMDVSDREAAKEKGSVVDCPYTDASYDVDTKKVSSKLLSSNNNMNNYAGGLSEAQARRLAQEDAANALGGGGDGGAFRWQQSRKRARDDQGGNDDDAKRQAFEEDNPENCSLFLHGLHRDPNMTLTNDVLIDAFRPFGCVGVRFPRPKMMGQNHHHRHHHQQQNPSASSYAFVDFSSHEEASQCLANLKGEAVIRNIMLSLKWSSSGGNKKRMQQQPQMGIPPPPPSKRRNRLTEAECVDSTTLFLRLPPTVDSSSYETELELMSLFAQRTMEDELNVGVPADSADRITAADEPALRVQVRQPSPEMNYGFLTFASHAAALTTLVALTGHEDGGAVSDDKLGTVQSLAKEDNGTKAEVSSKLNGVTLYWAKGNQKSADDNGKSGNYGLNLNKRHFPPDARTDCWFCLASPTCEKHLIVTVFDEIYVCMPKGPVNEFHALIVPVEHGGEGAFVTKKLAGEMELVKSKLRSHARKMLQKDLFVFERCIQTKGGYHTHVQCIPVDTGSGPAIQSKMLAMAAKAGFQLREITSELSLNALEEDWADGYFYVEIPLPGEGGEYRRFIYRAGDNAANTDDNGQASGRVQVPLQFGREVLAEVLNKPEVGHWKACVVSKEREEELTAQFRNSLAQTM